MADQNGVANAIRAWLLVINALLALFAGLVSLTSASPQPIHQQYYWDYDYDEEVCPCWERRWR